MKKTGALLFCLVLLAGSKSFAQITITENDLQSYLTIGNVLSVLDDTSTTSLNIGGTGQTSWDFSGLSSDLQFTLSCVNPSTTPYGGHFPSATVSFFDTTLIQGYLLQSWVYFGVNNGLLQYGSVGEGSAGGFNITFISHNNPAAKNIIVPLTMGTNWSENYTATDTTLISPLPPNVSITNYHNEYAVDAYGNMTLPGGATVPALRVRLDSRSNGTEYNRSIAYLFLTNNGTQISVDAADTTSPNTGVIPVKGISFINAGITDVRQANNTIPDNFNLEQNYPNPFNPTTQINYSIPSSQKVVLKVYDELGREVATLVNIEQPAGNYSADFNAAGLASGVYFYRLQAGNFIEMKKMILMK
ncbi:MAG TPA: T9SS type A sorting domain-containing protein [Ignavibacteriaceae bacterium]|nr:T9SS type A sorting domain-containing protein [Ignavibacteriaceae bacterium]